MVEPLRIVDLAKRMIHLSGYIEKDQKYPEGDIEIIYTGLRVGEKLYEELLANGENKMRTHHKKIMIAKLKDIDWNDTITKIEELSSENQFMTD